ncbi:MAG: hypothetical protein U0325_09740 [Polyangiales bacterium]
MSTVVLLGPQTVSVDAGRALRDLGVTRDVALITAGWQEREGEDEDLVARLGVSARNLRLHKRSEEVFHEDAELTAAYKSRQERLRHMQDFYRIRLDHADDAAEAIAVRHVEPELLAQEWKVSVDVLKQLDDDHLTRCRRVHGEFDAAWEPWARPSVARHRQELQAILAQCGALVIAGGHVASLLNRMRLFGVMDLSAALPVVAWSAGAMVLTDRVVLFHDHPPYGKNIAQVLDVGFAWAPGLVVLPDPRRRIKLDDQGGIARFAQRMAPATCVALDHGASLTLEGGCVKRAAADRLTPDGTVELDWNGWA